ncbi:helix-turn-helix domain-containing protein [Paucibacter sp. PLA-PC-4]|uniref:winged helix-turn-helix transcriptional regulator n=1 Tax=Paucibacter sp. PLA-PC-4 TaxID=2993655 RepID=UPI002248C13D|nr:helix-turn-helix domain-containing protein [Paucibacter sp. PLA-PC-4]MCX2862425.1 helix-turn-helix domain-containing protein [Paucibacter sp. PLA-PC-4]
MALLDLLGRRWAMRILWEANNYPLSFGELQEKCGQISSSVLSTRLADLKEADLIILGEHGYELSECGRELMELISPLRDWSEKWAASLKGS